MKPYRTLVSKMIGGVLTGFAGFSVGREGPAVQIGGSAGKIVSLLDEFGATRTAYFDIRQVLGQA